MKKQFLKLGKALNKAEQKQIFGGTIDLEVESGELHCTNQCSSDTGCLGGKTCLTRTCLGHDNWRYCG